MSKNSVVALVLALSLALALAVALAVALALALALALVLTYCAGGQVTPEQSVRGTGYYGGPFTRDRPTTCIYVHCTCKFRIYGKLTLYF